MKKPIRILHLEDSQHDAELVQSMLTTAGLVCEVTRVETRKDFIAAIDQNGHDLIISDYTLPSFNGKAALEIARGKCPEVPFLFVSGTIGEDSAIDSLLAGAADYIIKHNLKRLVPAVRRVLQDAENWRKRKQAELEVQKLSSAIEQTANCVLITDKKGIIEYVNPSFVRTTGYTKEEAIGNTPRILKSGKHDERFYKGLWETLLSGRVFVAEFINRKKSGELFYQEESITPILNSEGNITHFVATGRDITDRKRGENELKKSEEKYRSLVNNINDGFFTADLQGKITFANEALAEIQGYKSKDDIIGKHFSSFIPPGLRDKMAEQRRRSLETGIVETFEVPIIKADGTTGFIELKPSPMLEGDKIIGDMGVIRDVTERKKLEEQMRQVQKMESIGTLASGIAHDFNNILGIIMAYATLLQRGSVKPEEISSSIGTILDAVQRGATLVRQILTFARKSDVIMEDVRVNDVIKDLDKMLKETFPKNIEIRFDLDSSISPVSIDSGQFHQAMLNLCVNARDAVLDAVKQGSSNGLITIQTRLVNAEELIDHKIHAAMGSYVAVTVSDTGMGMSAITKQRIFEPFFTTKEPGKGTGLGLAVVYGIVKSHQGFIDVKSEIGRGTDFVLYFPARRSQATEKKPLMQSLRGVPGGSETILLVEDEMALMELLKNLLQNKGYTVLTATDGLEAVELYTRNKDTIHLVLSDHGLPKLSGSEVFKRMKQLNPKVKAILASGYIEPNQKSEIFKSGIKDFVQKPYDPQEVLRKVREVLDL